MSPDYQKKYRNERIVIDYIAGMTDDFFLREVNRIKENKDENIKV